MDGADEVLHGRLVRQGDQVLNVVHDEPRQVLRVVQVLTLREKTIRLTSRWTSREQTGTARAAGRS